MQERTHLKLYMHMRVRSLRIHTMRACILLLDIMWALQMIATHISEHNMHQDKSMLGAIYCHSTTAAKRITECDKEIMVTAIQS